MEWIPAVLGIIVAVLAKHYVDYRFEIWPLRADRDHWRRKAEARDWGPVVTIRSEDRGRGLFCNTNCDLSSKTLCIHQTGHSTSGTYHPKDGCPKPAPEGKQWQLCLVDKEATDDR